MRWYPLKFRSISEWVRGDSPSFRPFFDHFICSAGSMQWSPLNFGSMSASVRERLPLADLWYVHIDDVIRYGHMTYLARGPKKLRA
jgi:hypothetical protein